MFGAFFDDDLTKLNKGTLSPRDAAGKALSHLRLLKGNHYAALASDSRNLLEHALLKMSTVDLAKVLAHYPDVLSFVSCVGPKYHEAYLLINQVNESTPDPMLSACSDKTANFGLTLTIVLQIIDPLLRKDSGHKISLSHILRRRHCNQNNNISLKTNLFSFYSER